MRFNGRIAQIADIVMYFNLKTNYVAHLTFDGKNDLFITKLSKENEVIFSKKIDQISKKSESFVEKELQTIAENLLKYKNE